MRASGVWCGLATALLPTAHAWAQTDAPLLPPARPADLQGAVPLPPPRPSDLGPTPSKPPFGPAMPAAEAFGPPMPPRPPAVVSAPAQTGVPPDQDAACGRLLQSGHVVARTLPTIAPTPEGCGVASPIEMSAVVGPDRHIVFEPPITIDCALGEALAAWVRDDLVPAFAASGAALAALSGTSGYACRSRNHVAGAKTSEHGRGNALDTAAFRRVDGTTIGVAQAGVAILSTVRATACARFATVLGPGSDGFHESHLHVDLEPRRHASRLCQWDLP